MKISTPDPPRSLSREARAWWRQLCSDFAIEDAGGLLILRAVLEALDRMRQAQRALRRDGCTVRDRFGQVRAHPAAAIERDSRAAMFAGFRALHLDLEPLADRPGRPSGR